MERGGEIKCLQRMTSMLEKTPDYSPWFSAITENFDFGGKGYQTKAHLKGNRMVQISAS